MKTISRYIMTLALLLTAVTGAWAEEKSETISTTTSQAEYTGEHFKITPNKQNDGLMVADLRNYNGGQVDFSVETLDGQNISKLDLQINNIFDTSIDNLSLSSGTKSYDSNTKVLTITNVNAATVQISLTEADQYGRVTISSVTYYYEEASSGPVVTWNAATKTGNFSMPASDVVLTPQYAPAAKWAVVDNVEQLPAALEGVIADTDAPLIVEGTVAFAGQSTEVKQGTVMYAVTPATETQAPALDAANKWSADVPTAKLVADGGIDVLVWYYIKGADAPDGQQATEENTFNDTEICATPIKVTVLSNKFDIQFNAANANTIEAGKATVTVDGTDATVTEGKLQGVKMGREVKLKANEGYKFRKVEVKKKEEAPTTVTWNNLNFQGTTYTQDGVTLTPSSGDGAFSNALYDYGENTFTTTLGKFTKIEIVCTGNNLDGWTKETAGKFQPNPDGDPDYWKDLYKMTWTGNAESITLKEKYVYEIQSITFTIQ